MVTKEQFIKLINDNKQYNQRLDEVGNVLGCSIFDCDWAEYGNVLFDTIINLLFQKEAVNDINWWLYEKQYNPTLKMWDENENEIPTETVEDLWNIVKDKRI